MDDVESLVLPKRMCRLRINGERELRGNWLIQVHLKKWLLKRSVCAYVCFE